MTATGQSEPQELMNVEVESPPLEVVSTANEPQGTNTQELSETIQELLTELQSMKQGFSELERGFEAKIKYDTNKDKVIDSLHRELQSYRDGLHFKILRPILIDLISMYDDFDSLLKHDIIEVATSETETRFMRNLLSFQGTIEDILYRYGVEVYQENGDVYVGQKQRSIDVVPTDNLEQDKLVAERVRRGFAYDSKVLRPELVKTYRYQPVPAEVEQQGGSDNG